MKLIRTESENLVVKLMRAKRDWDRAVGHLINYSETWESIASKKLEGIVQFWPAEHPAGPLLGSVLTRDFQIHFAPFQREESVYAQAVVEVHSTREIDPVEVCRFLIDKTGQICDTEGQVILSDDDEAPHLTLICCIARDVLAANV